MRYEAEDWVAIYTRDTGGWVALHPIARFISLELTRKLGTSGELSLGSRGLEALAALLHAPWAVLEEHVRTLIDEGRLVYDEERQTIADPQHVERQAAARARPDVEPALKSSVRVTARSSGLSDSPAAVRAREYRARKRAEAARMAAQMGLSFPSSGAHDDARARDARRDARDERDAHVTRHASSRSVAVAAAKTPGIAEVSGVFAERDARDARARADLDLDLSIFTNSEDQISPAHARTVRVTHDPERPLPEYLAAAAEERPDLGEATVRRSFERFARATIRHDSAADALAHWRNWIRRERAMPWRDDERPPVAKAAPDPSRRRRVREPAPELEETELASREVTLAGAARLRDLFQVPA